MTPFQHFRGFYGEARWPKVLKDYMRLHYVYCSPTCICLAKPDGDTWFIEYCAGDMWEACQHLPFELPLIGFFRKGGYRHYRTDTLFYRLQKPNYNDKASINAAIKDGPSDPLLRWRRGESAQAEATVATGPIDRC